MNGRACLTNSRIENSYSFDNLDLKLFSYNIKTPFLDLNFTTCSNQFKHTENISKATMKIIPNVYSSTPSITFLQH